MEQIIEQLMKVNERDWLDVIGILIPIILTVVIIIQNIIYFNRSDKLQKQIHNRDRINQYHNDILMIYNTYYEFSDVVFTSGFADNVKSANINRASTWTNNLITLRISIGRKIDLSKLIFGQSNKKLYCVLEERFKLAIEIIDKYLSYVNSGRLFEVSENAWATVIPSNPLGITFKYNYEILAQNKTMYDNFMKLCQSEELVEIETLTKDYQDKHKYDNFDKYFEEYFSLDKL